ncbi:FG-GAP-like repeat-containing protein, partial [Actinomadura fulvescens]
AAAASTAAPAAAASTAAESTAVASAAAAAGAARSGARPYDFNGDGRRDLAIGSPNGTVAGKRGAGFVSVVHGSRSGLDTRRKKVISQNTPGVPGAAETGDHFGSGLVSADFNRDGYADLAVGAPGEDAGRRANAGNVTIIWGSRSGLGSRASAYGEAGGGARHRFGETLTVGDIQGDGSPELFVSVPGTSSYTWLYFGSGRARAVGARTLSAVDVDRSWLASGDVNGDGRGDVVYAWFDADDPEIEHRRGFTVFHGTANGRFSKGRTVYTTVHALAVGDFNGDRRADIAVGDTDDRPSVGGRVTVYRGGLFGLGGSYAIDQATSGVPGLGINEDVFGYSLAVGDANRDGRADLAVGAPKADVGRTFDAGRAYLLLGSPKGLTGRGARTVSQNTSGVPGGAEEYDHFGFQVSLLDHTGDGAADLAVGAPDEDRGDGGVTVVRGAPAGLTTHGAVAVGSPTFGTRGRNARLGGLLGR